MGALIMPKQSADKDEMKAVLAVYNEADDWLENSVFIDEIKRKINSELEPQAYTKKTQIPAYYQFITWQDLNNSQSPRKITEMGKRFYNALENNDESKIVEILLETIETTVFGRNVCGCSTDSDIEPPCLFIRCALILKYLTRKEFGYIIYEMADNGADLFNVISKIVNMRELEDKLYYTHHFLN